MTNLGQTCLFPNLILLYLNGVCFGLVPWEQSFFNRFQGRNLLGDDQNFKRGGKVKKEENQISKWEGGAGFFLSIKTFVSFCSCFSRYFTKQEIPKVNDCLVVFNINIVDNNNNNNNIVDLDARRILKYLNIDLNTDHVFQTLILLLSPCVNTV